MSDFMVGVVGKPSSGKSTFLNAATDASAKMGNFPFTTIEPNKGVAFCVVDCPCVEHSVTDKCQPKYGTCVGGKRHIPVEVLDVAGLVPGVMQNQVISVRVSPRNPSRAWAAIGAADGAGLGNKFLDDLRHAQVLLHVVDVSGTTNEKGEVCQGYDPTYDVQWLKNEIHEWIYNNMWKKWGSITRRHKATNATALDTLQRQLTGYSSRESHVYNALKLMAQKKGESVQWEIVDDEGTPARSVAWSMNDLEDEEECGLQLEIDHPDADKNIERICRKYPNEGLVLCSALSEVFLKKIAKQKYIDYQPGDENFKSLEDDPKLTHLKPVDEKLRIRLSNVRDMVIFRHGGTGVQDAVRMAVDTLGFFPVYPVKNRTTFTDGKSPGAFRECVLMPTGSIVRDLVRKVCGSGEPSASGTQYLYCEGLDGRRLADDDVLNPPYQILRMVFGQVAIAPGTTSTKPPEPGKVVKKSVRFT